MTWGHVRDNHLDLCRDGRALAIRAPMIAYPPAWPPPPPPPLLCGRSEIGLAIETANARGPVEVTKLTYGCNNGRGDGYYYL